MCQEQVTINRYITSGLWTTSAWIGVGLYLLPKIECQYSIFVKSMGSGASDRFNYLSLNPGSATYNFSFLLYERE